MAQRYEAQVTRTYDAPRALMWAIVGDSNRLNRVLKVPATYTGVARDDAGQLARTAKTSELGVAMEWIEPPYEWVKGRYLDTHRVYTKGPVVESGVQASLADEADGRTRVTLGAWFR